jgi:hypothetical protein
MPLKREIKTNPPETTHIDSLQSCEVYSSGTDSPGRKFKNRHDSFPTLNLEEVTAQAEVWGKEFSLIERIILYRALSEGPQKDDPAFVLAVDVTGVNSLGSTTRDALLDETVNSWQPDSLRFRIDQEYLNGFGKDSDDIINNWIIILREPGEEIIEVDSDRCWVLFDRCPRATAGLPEKVLKLARQVRIELDYFYKTIESDLRYELDAGEYSGKERTSEIWKEQTVKTFEEMKPNIKFIKKEMLEADELYLGTAKRSRSFIQHLLGAIVEDRGLGRWSTQELYVASGRNKREKPTPSKKDGTQLKE